MKQEFREIDEEEYKEFFEWILEKKVEIVKELDLTLAREYNEPYIYYTREINEFFNTAPMKRIGKINQLGTSIIDTCNSYHTRLEHCKGAYKNALDFWVLRCKDNTFREYVEKENLKIHILADIMEMARHDDCHTMLSHALEGLLCNGTISHEDVGKRILLENKEYEQVLNNIYPELYRVMCENTKSEKSNFKFLKEGNIDFDREDYLVRDLLYLNGVQIRGLIEILNANCDIKQVQIEGKEQEIPVYRNDIIPYIKEFLKTRRDSYKAEYTSPRRKILDYKVRYLCMQIVKDESDIANFIKKSVQNYMSDTVQNIDIDQYLETDDIRFYNDVLDIALKHNDPNLRQLAIECLPDIYGLIQMTIEMLDTKNRKDYTKEENEFINKIINLKKPDSELGNILRNRNRDKDSYTIVEAEEEYNKICELLLNQLKAIDLINVKGIINAKIKIKTYKPDEEIYVEKENGEVCTLDNYPGMEEILKDIEIYTIGVLPTIMKQSGYNDQQIQQICRTIQEYNKNVSDPVEIKCNKMSKFKVESEPYIIGVER